MRNETRRRRSFDRRPKHRAASASDRQNGNTAVFTAPKQLPETMPTWQPDCPFGGLIPELQHALAAINYQAPTPIQRECLPHLLQRKDLLGSAQTGTGKTAAFILPLLQHIANHPKPYTQKSARVLILAPTRELALQIQQNIQSLGSFLKVREALVYGGVSQHPQEKAMRNGVDFLVATPGRLIDLIQQRMISLEAVETFVLDEADRMLDMGFIHDIRRILQQLPADKQSLFFSATLPKDIRALAAELLRNPAQVAIAPEEPTVDRIAQKVMFVNDKKKHSLLLSLFDDHSTKKVIVFTQMKHVANKLAEKLNKSGIISSAIHGNKSQAARVKALDHFRNGKVRVLVATDVAARGIDVDGITHVVNYQLPKEPETYVHRIGRTARAGESGHAVSFCSAEERGQLMGIERFLKKPIPADHEHAYHCALAAEPIRHSKSVDGNRNHKAAKSSQLGRNRPRPRNSWTRKRR
ncbi:MAG: DEAD/DEAH box helicase [Verrucomicrobia bacterium]|jgi:ATP-dependent RNA helicase RhlE|nr:DEAD/DEAH box helicase [Verrucomicrobiota bacterium]